MLSTEAEVRLQRIIDSNQPDKRAQWAREWKRVGGKVVGILCPFVPVEVLVAANIMPWRVSGTWSENIDGALAMRSVRSCGFCNHALQSFLDGDMAFLDGVVATSWEQDITRLWDLCLHLRKAEFNHILNLPHYVSARSVKYYSEEIAQFVTAVENFTDRKISSREMERAIAICNRRRSLIQQVYEMRKKEAPPLTGAEMVGLTVAGTLMPPEEFNRELEGLLPYIKQRKAGLASFSPRLLVSADFADNPAWVDAIESTGCLVAMDDFDTGSRYYWGLAEAGSPDPAMALARHYLRLTGAARMADWEAQTEQAVRWVGEYAIQGVIELTLRYSRAREMRRPFFLDRMKKAGIRAISLEREYVPGNLAQFRTRVEAFLEIVGPPV